MGAAGRDTGWRAWLVCAWLDSGHALCGLYLMPVYYGAKSAPQAESGRGRQGVCRAIGAGVSRIALRPENAGAERLPVCRDGVVQRGDFALCHGADLRGAACLRSHCDRSNLPPTGILLLAMALPAALVLAYVLLGGLGAAMYNQALQFCVVVAGHAARGAARAEEDWRMERIEGCGSRGLFA